MDNRGSGISKRKEATIREQSPIEVAARAVQQVVPPAGAKQRILHGIERHIQRGHRGQGALDFINLRGLLRLCASWRSSHGSPEQDH